MFGSKVQGARQRKHIRKINHELEMLEYAKTMNTGRNKAVAVAVRLSRAAGFNYDNYLYAVQMFRELVARFQGRLFILSNRDLVFGYVGSPNEPAVKDAVYKIRLLFNVGGDDSGGAFSVWYDLELDADAFVAYAQEVLSRRKPDLDDEPAAAPATPASSAGREGEAEDTPEPTPEAGATTDALSEFTRLLSNLDLGPLIRRQPIYLVGPDHQPQLVLNELYVSIDDLERQVPGIALLTGNRHLFHYAMTALDKSVLRFMKQQMLLLPSGNFTLNATVASLVSPEFAAFDAVLTDQVRQSVVLELPASDVMGDLGTFLAIADQVRSRGYRLCLDNLSPFTMPYFRLQDLSLDLFKIAWSPELEQETDAEQRSLLQGVVDRCGAGRMVMCRCDSAHAVAFGQSLGISLYQGRFLDEVVKTGR